MTLRVGVVGAGAMGTAHVRLIGTAVAGAAVVAVADTVADRAHRLADEAGARVHGDPFDVVRDPDVDAVLVASPGDTHEALVGACLEAGRPVLCEKPLATTADAARRVVEAEAALGRRLVQVGFMRRFDPGYVDMKRALDAGRIGRPLLAHSIHRNPAAPAWFDSELIVKDTCVHDVDSTRWLLGQEFVRATVHAPRPSGRAAAGLQDPLIVVLETDAGAVVTVEAFVNAGYAYDIRCEVVGEDGTVSLAPPLTVEVRRDGRAGADLSSGFEDRFAAAYTAELQAWVASVARGTPVGASAWDGYAAAAVCDAAYASLRSGAPAAVRLGPRPDLYAGA